MREYSSGKRLKNVIIKDNEGKKVKQKNKAVEQLLKLRFLSIMYLLSCQLILEILFLYQSGDLTPICYILFLLIIVCCSSTSQTLLRHLWIPNILITCVELEEFGLLSQLCYNDPSIRFFMSGICLRLEFVGLQCIRRDMAKSEFTLSPFQYQTMLIKIFRGLQEKCLPNLYGVAIDFTYCHNKMSVTFNIKLVINPFFTII